MIKTDAHIDKLKILLPGTHPNLGNLGSFFKILNIAIFPNNLWLVKKQNKRSNEKIMEAVLIILYWFGAFPLPINFKNNWIIVKKK